MIIEELAFKDRKNLTQLNEKDLLDIIEFLQNDRKQWINQFAQTHNESIDIQKENQKLEKQLEVGEEQYNDLVEEKENLQEQLSIKTLQLEELKKQLKNMTDNYCNASKLKHKRASKIVKMNNQQKKFIKWLEDEIHTIETTFSQINGNYGLMNEKLESLKEILQKYEEIIGENYV